MSGTTIAKGVQELASKLKAGKLINGRWIKQLSARQIAKIRRTELLAGREWPFEEPPKEVPVVFKGHKHDREAQERKKDVAEALKNMPKMISEYRANQAQRRLETTKKSLDEWGNKVAKVKWKK